MAVGAAGAGGDDGGRTTGAVGFWREDNSRDVRVEKGEDGDSGVGGEIEVGEADSGAWVV